MLTIENQEMTEQKNQPDERDFLRTKGEEQRDAGQDTKRRLLPGHLAAERLPPEQRAAIALFHIEDMSVAEVAVALDVPAGTVKTRLMTARAKLREAFEGDV